MSSIASRLATSTCQPKSIVLSKIYGRLNLNLICANATTVLAPPPKSWIVYLCHYCLYLIINFMINLKSNIILYDKTAHKQVLENQMFDH